MKFKVFAAMLLCSVVFFGCSEGEAGKKQTASKEGVKKVSESSAITWVYTLPESLELAKKENKPIMADFYADWCGWCKKLDKDVYTDPTVVALSKEFVCAKIDTDKYGKDASRFGVQGLPTIVFLNSDGSVRDTVVGYSPAPDFAASMKKALKK